MESPRRRRSVPCVTADQMRKVDRVATQEYRLHLLQMMENAGRHFAHLARERFLGESLQDQTVLVLCGDGGNGGGGLVAARRLIGWGATVKVVTPAPPDDFTGIPAHHMALIRRLDCPVGRAPAADEFPAADLLLDALIGYGLDGPLDDEVSTLIHRAIWHGAPALSLDVPSGLNATTGVPSRTTVHAEATLTLALPKCGLDAPAAQSAVGDLYLADIGIPPSLYDDALDLSDDVRGLFGKQDLLRLR
jgi:NAD(P)H-hydrate epimerase